jgi:hypothetical protein
LGLPIQSADNCCFAQIPTLVEPVETKAEFDCSQNTDQLVVGAHGRAPFVFLGSRRFHEWTKIKKQNLPKGKMTHTKMCRHPISTNWNYFLECHPFQIYTSDLPIKDLKE